MTLPSPPLDPRIHAFRPDLADLSLKLLVPAAQYVEPQPRQCIKGVLPLLAEPRDDARRVSELRYGEFLDLFELRDDGFAWVQNRHDRYVGYIRADGALSEEVAAFLNRVQVLKTFVYAEPNIKSPVRDCLTLGSFVRLVAEQGEFYELASGGYIYGRHVTPTDDTLTPDYVFTAGRLLHVPYLWGGRTPLGIDCSGLVQLALELAGIEAPRDSDQQREAYGQPLAKHWRDMPWRRGDLVFFTNPGHVGIMTDHAQIIHASGTAMQVVCEPLENLVLHQGREIVAIGNHTDIFQSQH
jgi:cell wall-associated NlpC family hydrolase